MQFADFYFKCEFIVHYRWLFISGSVTLCIPSSGGNCNGPVPTLLRRWEILGQGWRWEYLKARHAKGGVSSSTLHPRGIPCASLDPVPSPARLGGGLDASRRPARRRRPPASLPLGSRRGVRAQRIASALSGSSARGRCGVAAGSPGPCSQPRPVPGHLGPGAAGARRRPRCGSGRAPSAADAEREPGAGSRRASGELRGLAPGVSQLLSSSRGAPGWGGRRHRSAPRFPGCALRVGEGEEFHSRGFRGWGSLLLKRSWSGWWPWTESRGRRAPAGG